MNFVKLPGTKNHYNHDDEEDRARYEAAQASLERHRVAREEATANAYMANHMNSQISANSRDADVVLAEQEVTADANDASDVDTPTPAWLREKLYGPVDRLAELGTIANTKHAEFEAGMRRLLPIARAAGQALEEVFQLLKGTGRWREWIHDNFKGKISTADIYRRIFKTWNDPRMMEARRKGMEPNSIAAALNLLKSKGPKSNDRQLGDEDYELLHAIRDRFMLELEAMDPLMLEALFHNFDDLWRPFYDRLKFTVCVVTESDYQFPSDDLWPSLDAETQRAEEHERTKRETRYKPRFTTTPQDQSLAGTDAMYDESGSMSAAAE